VSKRVLVTGGLGFIGTGLVRKLIESGYDVNVLDNRMRTSVDRLGPVRERIKMFPADVRDAAAVHEAASGCNMVCHLAYVNGTRFFYEKPDLVLDIAVKGMVNVLEACKAHRIKELVLASSSEVYQTPPVIPTPEHVPLVVPDLWNPRFSYGGGKIISELLAVHMGGSFMDRVVIFRPHNVYGPTMGWEHVIPELVMRIYGATKAKGKSRADVPILGDGRQTRSFVFIDDFIDGVHRLIEHGRHLEVYHIGNTEELQIGNVAQLIAAHMQVEVQFTTSAPPAGEPTRRVPDISKMRALGYVPRVNFRAGLSKTLDWYLDHINEAPTVVPGPLAVKGAS
jgi:dTDP-glucose 4,6-dehydratase/UDP-glucose 4-epimerase